MELNSLSLSAACRVLVVSKDIAQSKELVSRKQRRDSSHH